jgi:flagellar basal-body rod modification protein FlgD
MTTFTDTLSKLGIKTSADQAASQAAKGNTTGTLGQADFLKLMTAQMKNQDPFNPTDNTQMIAQMAQFSSVAGIAEMNTTLKAMAERLGGTSTSDAVSYVGRTVLTAGTTAYPRTSGGIAGAIELEGATTATSVTISDATGNVMRTMDLGARDGGTVTYDWDGTDGQGNAVGTGPFTVTVHASNAGTSVRAQSLVWAPVESVTMTGSEPTLSVAGLGPVALSAVRQVG